MSGQTCPIGRINHSSRFACRGWRLVPFMGKRSYTACRFRLKGTAKKKKSSEKSVKAPLWHKRKKKWALHHQSKHRLGVRQSPFLRLCGSRHTFVQTCLGDDVPTDKAAFTGKYFVYGKKEGDLFQNLPFNCYFCIRRVLWRLRNAQKDDAVDN